MKTQKVTFGKTKLNRNANANVNADILKITLCHIIVPIVMEDLPIFVIIWVAQPLIYKGCNKTKLYNF